jgi:hypothetical protein
MAFIPKKLIIDFMGSKCIGCLLEGSWELGPYYGSKE